MKKRVKLFLIYNLNLHIGYYRLLMSVIEDKFDIVDENWDLIITSERELEGIRSQYPNDKILVFASETIIRKI